MLSGLVIGRVFLSAGATDMRKSFNGLSGLVRGQLGSNPLSGDLFVFCNGCKTRLKILYFDTSGLWVFAKRLERGTFAWPTRANTASRIELRYEELLLLVNGIDARDLRERKRWRRSID